LLRRGRRSAAHSSASADRSEIDHLQLHGPQAVSEERLDAESNLPLDDIVLRLGELVAGDHDCLTAIPVHRIDAAPSQYR
jgi:hypothetical protein